MAKDNKSRITDRDEYLKAKGYNVTLEVRYKRTRRVRALDEDQAKEFARNREEVASSRYFNSQNITNYDVLDVQPVLVELAKKDE